MHQNRMPAFGEKSAAVVCSRSGLWWSLVREQRRRSRRYQDWLVCCSPTPRTPLSPGCQSALGWELLSVIMVNLSSCTSQVPQPETANCKLTLETIYLELTQMNWYFSIIIWFQPVQLNDHVLVVDRLYSIPTLLFWLFTYVLFTEEKRGLGE